MAIVLNGQILKSECLCSINVHTATKVIIWIQLIFQSLAILATFMGMTAVTKGQSRENMMADGILQTLSYAVGVILCVMVLHGLNVKRPGYYWPYLIWTAFGIIILSVGIILVVSLVDDRGKDVMPVIILLVMLLIVFTYFNLIVVNRSRQLLEAEIISLQSNPEYNLQAISQTNPPPQYNPQYNAPPQYNPQYKA